MINEVDPASLFVSLDGPADEGSEKYIVELQLDDGDSVRVGRLEMRDGRGALAVTVDLDGSTGARRPADRWCGRSAVRSDVQLTPPIPPAVELVYPGRPASPCSRSEVNTMRATRLLLAGIVVLAVACGDDDDGGGDQAGAAGSLRVSGSTAA